MYALGIMIPVAVVLYYGFLSLDRAGVSDQNGPAVVVDKRYREAHTTYTRTIIDNRTVTVPSAVPEMFALVLDLNGQSVTGSVDRQSYETSNPGDTVQVTYRRRRLTGRTEVIRVAKR
jgi:hypothetical protein